MNSRGSQVRGVIKKCILFLLGSLFVAFSAQADILFSREGYDTVYVYLEVGPVSFSQTGVYASAIDSCTMVIVNDALENEWLQENLSPIPQFWMGITDASHEGVWLTFDAQQLTYTNWGSGEPNNCGPYCGDEDYGVFRRTTGGTWNDNPNYYPAWYIYAVLECHDGDGDGNPDHTDGCPGDPNKSGPGVCGCGVDDELDSDGDGTFDCLEECPYDPDKTVPGLCGCGENDEVDSDGDSIPDCKDECLADPRNVCIAHVGWEPIREIIFD